MTMHTPGPWIGKTQGEADAYFMMTKTRWLFSFRQNGEIWTAEQMANLALIAAAPELLAALIMVRDADNDCRADGLPTIPDMARAKIDAAIAKAEAPADD